MKEISLKINSFFRIQTLAHRERNWRAQLHSRETFSTLFEVTYERILPKVTACKISSTLLASNLVKWSQLKCQKTNLLSRRIRDISSFLPFWHQAVREMRYVLCIWIVQPSPVSQNSSTTETLRSIQVSQKEPPRSSHFCGWRSCIPWPLWRKSLQSIHFVAQIQWFYQRCLFRISNGCKLPLPGDVEPLKSW